VKKETKNIYIEKGLESSGDVFAVLEHTAHCKECQDHFQAIMIHSKTNNGA
jgi:hypothetical protein